MEVGTYSIATMVGGAQPPSHGSDRPQSTPCSVARQQAASPGFSTQSNKRCDPVRLRKRFCNCVATAARYASVPSWAVLVRAARKASAPTGSGSGCSGPCLKWVKLRRTHREQMSSGLPLKADIAQCSRHVSNVPQPDSRTASKHHSITSSARTSINGGIARPSTFAVFRLRTNSNLADCTTGRSAGLAPLRIWPV
jgi:hypothetical protein